MKNRFVALLPLLLTGCSYYHHMVERMNTDTLRYQCDEQPLVVERHPARQQISFMLDDKPLWLTQGLSASGERFSDGEYVFWDEGDKAKVYYHDRIILNNCQLPGPER